MSHFLYRLIPPRRSFAADMDEDEAAIMGEHFTYWHKLMTAGQVLVFGPVADPAGVWGLCVLEAAGDDEARSLADGDPAITSGLGTYELHPIDAVVPGQPA